MAHASGVSGPESWMRHPHAFDAISHMIVQIIIVIIMRSSEIASRLLLCCCKGQITSPDLIRRCKVG